MNQEQKAKYLADLARHRTQIVSLMTHMETGGFARDAVESQTLAAMANTVSIFGDLLELLRQRNLEGK